MQRKMQRWRWFHLGGDGDSGKCFLNNLADTSLNGRECPKTPKIPTLQGHTSLHATGVLMLKSMIIPAWGLSIYARCIRIYPGILSLPVTTNTTLWRWAERKSQKVACSSTTTKIHYDLCRWPRQMIAKRHMIVTGVTHQMTRCVQITVKYIIYCVLIWILFLSWIEHLPSQKALLLLSLANMGLFYQSILICVNDSGRWLQSVTE